MLQVIFFRPLPEVGSKKFRGSQHKLRGGQWTLDLATQQNRHGHSIDQYDRTVELYAEHVGTHTPLYGAAIDGLSCALSDAGIDIQNIPLDFGWLFIGERVRGWGGFVRLT